MKKNDVFEFTAPNGSDVQAVVIMDCGYTCLGYFDGFTTFTWLCYAQNRLFTYIEIYNPSTEYDENGEPYYKDNVEYEYGEIIAEYAVIPEYDDILEAYQHQLDMADDYASKEV